jgi:hypothetical protein
VNGVSCLSSVTWGRIHRNLLITSHLGKQGREPDGGICPEKCPPSDLRLREARGSQSVESIQSVAVQWVSAHGLWRTHGLGSPPKPFARSPKRENLVRRPHQASGKEPPQESKRREPHSLPLRFLRCLLVKARGATSVFDKDAVGLSGCQWRQCARRDSRVGVRRTGQTIGFQQRARRPCL